MGDVLMFVTKELFDETIGVLIKKCQCIEHDVKIMYAGMLQCMFQYFQEYLKRY